MAEAHRSQVADRPIAKSASRKRRKRKPAPLDPASRAAALSALGLIAIATIIFAPILRYMVLHWKTVDDYSHGFLIVPLALYFAYERKGKLRKMPIEPSWWGMVPLALGTLSLTVGRLGTELMTMRAAYVLTLIGIVISVAGLRVFRVLAFPLLFLFMMVPLPQSVVNVIAFPLQLIAADMAVNALYLLEIPALREGNIIHLSNTQLFVAEACSGLRSLMALLTLGVIFAYFFRRSFVERAIIVISTIPIAIFVNAFRVGLTGVLTHHLGSEAASGWIHQNRRPVHVRAGLLPVDGRGVAAPADLSAAQSVEEAGGDDMKIAATLLFLGLQFYLYHYFASEAVIPPRESFESFPLEVSDWQCENKQILDDKIIANLGVTDYLICDYISANAGVPPVQVYVGYHERQVREEGGGGGDFAIHPPRHCLPGGGWDIIAMEVVPADLPNLPGESPEVNRIIAAKGEQRALIYYWYQSRGRVIAEDWKKLISLFWDRATTGRTDGSLVRFTVAMKEGEPELSDAAFNSLAKELVPILPPYIPGRS